MKQRNLKSVLLACSFAVAAVNFGHSGMAFADETRPGESDVADEASPGEGQGDQGDIGEQDHHDKDKDKNKEKEKKDDQGEQGNPGDQGEEGEQGEEANPGEQGEEGEQGNPGEQGEEGEEGEVSPGDQGEANPDEASPQEEQALIPTELSTIKNLAKEAFDQAVNENHTELTTTAEAIRTDWKDFRRAALRKGVPYRTVREMDHQTRRLVRLAKKGGVDHLVLAYRVNKINRLMPTIYGVYKSNIPTQIFTLNYLSRVLILDGHMKKDRDAKRHLVRMERAYKALHPKLMRVNGETESTSFSAKIVDMQTAIKDKMHADISRIGQESVDVLNRIEELF